MCDRRDQLLRTRDGGRARRQQFIGGTLHRGVQFRGGHGPVHETDALRFAAVEPFAGEEQRARAASTDLLQHERRDHRRHDAELDLGEAELAILGADREIDGRRKAGAAPEGVAMDAADDGFLAARDGEEHTRHALGAGSVAIGRQIGLFLHPGEVGTSGEALAVATQHDHARGRVRVGSREGGLQLVDEDAVERVANVGAIEANVEDRPFVDDLESLVAAHLAGRVATLALRIQWLPCEHGSLDGHGPPCDNAPPVPPAFRVLLAGALFATGGALIKSCDYPSLQRAGMRACIAALTIFVLLPQARRWPNRRILRLVPAYFGATCLFVVANTLTTAANAIFLQSTFPLWLILLGPWLLHERPSRCDLLVLACIGIGMTLFFLAPTAAVPTAPDPRLGDWFAIASGLSYAMLLLGMRWLGRAGHGEACAAIAWGNALSFPLAFALMPAVGQTPVVGSGQDWLVILLLGIFQVGLAYSLLVRALERVPAMQASLLLMIEPTLNPMITYVTHGEAPHGLAITGGVLIVGAVLLGSVLARPRAEPTTTGDRPG